MRIVVGILLILIGIAAMGFGLFVMPIIGHDHLFSIGGGMLYDSLACLLIAGGFFLILIGWGVLADD